MKIQAKRSKSPCENENPTDLRLFCNTQDKKTIKQHLLEFSGKMLGTTSPIECSNYCTVAFISHASKIILAILQARLQQYVNCELPDLQAGFRKGRGTRDQIADICWIIKKARAFHTNIYFCFIAKALTVWITINCGQF